MDIKELEKTVKDLVDAYNSVEHSPGGITVFNFIARGLESAGYILPASSSLKLIDNTKANGYGFPFRVFEAWKDGRNKQLLSDQKAHASILAEKAREQAKLEERERIAKKLKGMSRMELGDLYYLRLEAVEQALQGGK